MGGCMGRRGVGRWTCEWHAQPCTCVYRGGPALESTHRRLQRGHRWDGLRPAQASCSFAPPPTTCWCCCLLLLRAVDCARVLLKPADDLAGTDICSHAVEQLRWVPGPKEHTMQPSFHPAPVPPRPTCRLGWAPAARHSHCAVACHGPPCVRAGRQARVALHASVPLPMHQRRVRQGRPAAFAGRGACHAGRVNGSTLRPLPRHLQAQRCGGGSSAGAARPGAGRLHAQGAARDAEPGGRAGGARQRRERRSTQAAAAIARINCLVPLPLPSPPTTPPTITTHRSPLPGPGRRCTCAQRTSS